MSAKPETTKFCISDDENSENWSNGQYDTFDEAVAQGRLDYPGKVFWVAACWDGHANEFIPTAREIIEIASNVAYEEMGEAASEWPDLPESSAAEIELDILLTQWSMKHVDALRLRAWHVDSPGTRIEPLEKT